VTRYKHWWIPEWTAGNLWFNSFCDIVPARWALVRTLGHSSMPGLVQSQRQGPADQFVKSLVDYRKTTFEGFVSSVNVALDTIGRDAQVIENVGVSAGYFYVEVTTGRLNKRTGLLTDERSAH